MKRASIIVLVLLSVAACKKQDPVPCAFKEARCGMTREALKKAIPAATEQEGYFALTDVEYAGLPARVGLVFRGADTLQYTFIEFTKGQGSFDKYEEMKNRLAAKFGKPFREDSSMAGWRTIWGGYEGGNAAILEQSGLLGDGTFSLVLGPSDTLAQMISASEQSPQEQPAK